MEENLGSLTDCYVIQENGKKAMAVTGGGQALDVLPQDPTTRSGDVIILQFLNSVTLAAAVNIGDYTFTLVAGHGVVVGNHVTFVDGIYYFQALVIDVTVNLITINIPFGYPYDTDAVCARENSLINGSNGSVNRVIFQSGPPAGKQWDIYGFSIAMRDITDMDDAKFAGASALTRGLILGKYTGTLFEPRVVVQSNSDMKLIGEFAYSAKAPSGEYGCDWYKDFRSTDGVAMRLDGDLGEKFYMIISDDMSFLTYGKAMIHGHAVED